MRLRSGARIAKVIAVWLGLLVTVVLVGAVRERVLRPVLGEQRAHQLGTLAACVTVFLVLWVATGWLRPRTTGEALGLGAVWLCLAVAFEVGVFHGVSGVPLEVLARDYDLSHGRLLPLLWLTVLLGPAIAFVIRRRRSQDGRS